MSRFGTWSSWNATRTFPSAFSCWYSTFPLWGYSSSCCKKACFVSYALVEGCFYVINILLSLTKGHIEVPGQAVFDIPMRTYAMGGINDILQVVRTVQGLVHLISDNIVDHVMDSIMHTMAKIFLHNKNKPFFSLEPQRIKKRTSARTGCDWFRSSYDNKQPLMTLSFPRSFAVNSVLEKSVAFPWLPFSPFL